MRFGALVIGSKRLGNADAATLWPGSVPMLEILLSGVTVVAMLVGPPALLLGFAIHEQKVRPPAEAST
jgi:hypothetical protein